MVPYLFFRLTYGWVHCCWNVVKIYIGWKVSFLFRVWMRGLSFRWVWCHISWTCWYLKLLVLDGSKWSFICLTAKLFHSILSWLISRLYFRCCIILYHVSYTTFFYEPLALRWHTRNCNKLFSKKNNLIKLIHLPGEGRGITFNAIKCYVNFACMHNIL